LTYVNCLTAKNITGFHYGPLQSPCGPLRLLVVPVKNRLKGEIDAVQCVCRNRHAIYPLSARSCRQISFLQVNRFTYFFRQWLTTSGAVHGVSEILALYTNVMIYLLTYLLTCLLTYTLRVTLH